MEDIPVVQILVDFDSRKAIGINEIKPAGRDDNRNFLFSPQGNGNYFTENNHSEGVREALDLLRRNDIDVSAAPFYADVYGTAVNLATGEPETLDGAAP